MAIRSIAIALAATCAGCRTTSAPSPAPRYFIAHRFDVGTRFIGVHADHAWKEIRADLDRIAEAGFDSVLLAHADHPDRRLALLDHCRTTGLRALLSDPSITAAVNEGALPRGCISMAGLPEFLPDRLVTHAAFGAVVLPADGRRSIVAGARVGELVRSFRDASVACVIYSEAQPPVTHAALRAGPDEAGSRSAVSGPRPGATTVAGAELAVIDADRLRGDDDSPVVEELLRAYHAELVAGHTAGVVLYKQRRFEPGSTGTNVITDALNKRQRAALNLLIRRAKYWGSFIVGSAAHPITATAEATEALEIVAFAPGGARFVLVWNTAPDRFARGSVLLPDTLLGRAVGRVVEVPPIPGRGAGHVLDSDRSNRFRISINLRPGDAALFEIFPPA